MMVKEIFFSFIFLFLITNIPNYRCKEGYGYTQEEEEEIYDEYYSQERQPKKSKKSVF